MSSEYPANATSTLSPCPSASTPPTEMSTPRDEMPEVNDDILGGLEDVVVLDFKGPRSLKKQIDSRLKELQASSSCQQFIVCRNVGKEQLTSIDQQQSLGRGIRKSYNSNLQILVLKILTTIHEAAHLTLWQIIWRQLIAMGDGELMAPCGGGTFLSQSKISSKEADTAYKPVTRNQESDWPTIVLECGYSESMRRLAVDARWWLVNAGGDVKTVLLISINGERQALHLERWCLAPPYDRPVTRNTPSMVPTKTGEVDIVAGIVTGAPLCLKFEDLVERPPGPTERDVVLTADQLATWANFLWTTYQ
ncbi:hypothetical protein DTO006G1_6456 [Penicillium roqueforti]|nr:uncharacterized protein LCP9604111_8111 [Penicillium roqueforti]KAF9242203.1 hypothetical protein LCP9604111_8111 [Penicillium roqueforti]KAI1833369.1 hypothetical protein CBS147337_5867 [Penicillium roqueforti]KAI2675196.1 hypothetical protein LCP963914a_8599 [Penicillium roqueforti]KAI2697577.1 hypothetical protein CBS147372_7618 [Penicillium roqueforti]KAI2713175.1 hypothetical protein CBS147318_7314 [Penicillium roqueforti]